MGSDSANAVSSRLHVFGGGVNANDLEIGRFVNNIGVLDITDASWIASSSFFNIGVEGNGTLSISGGNASHLFGWLAYQPDSSGELTVSGAAQWNVTGDLVVGRLGTATVTLTDNGKSQVGRCILGELSGGISTSRIEKEIGDYPKGSGALIVETGGELNTTLDNDISLIVGQGGQGTLTVRNGGSVQNSGLLHVAEYASGTGHVLVSNAGGNSSQLTSQHQLAVGLNGAEGTVDVIGSSLTVSGRNPSDPNDYVSVELGRYEGHGILNVTAGGYVHVPYGGAVGTGIFSVGGSGPGDMTIEGSLVDITHVMEVGRDATGNVIVRGGGALTLSGGAPDGGYSWVGMRAPGRVTVNGSDSQWVVNSELSIGAGHQGTLEVSDQGLTRVGVLVVGDTNTSESDGHVSVTGTNSQLTTDLCRIANEASGHMVVTNGASLTTNRQLQVGYLAHGSVEISGSAHAVSYKASSATQSSGILGFGSAVTGALTVSGTNSTWTQDGVLNVGWTGNGTLTIDSGGLVSSMGGVIAREAGSSGTVEVTGPNSRWTISDSLCVGGLLETPGGTGSLSVLQNATVTAGNTLCIRAGSSMRLDSGHAAVGTGAVAIDPGVMTLHPGGILSGTGTLTSNLANSGGTLSPGTSTGTFLLNGTYVQSGTGSLAIEIGGTAPGTFDQLHVNGTANLEAILTISIVNGFAPAAGNTFEIVNASTRTGKFSWINGQHAASHLRFYPTYTGNSVILTVLPTSLADFDEDGDVDAEDLAQFRTCMTRSGVHYAGGCTQKDFDGDGDVDMNDFGRFQREYSGMGQPAAPN